MSPTVARDYVTVAKDLKVARFHLQDEEKEVKRAERGLNTLHRKKRDACAVEYHKSGGNFLWLRGEYEKKEKDVRGTLRFREDRVVTYRDQVGGLEDEIRHLEKPETIRGVYEKERPGITKKTTLGANAPATKKTTSAAPSKKPVVEPASEAKQLTVKLALKEVDLAFKDLAAAQSKGGQLTVNKWQKKYDNAAKTLVAAYAAEGTIIGLEKLNGRPTPTGLKDAAAASRREANSRKRKVTDVAKAAQPLKQSKPNTAALAGSDPGERTQGEKRKRGDDDQVAGKPKKAKPTTEAVMQPAKTQYPGITHKPFRQQVLDAKRHRKGLSPQEAAQATAAK
ncbi:hypothetical protein LTR36_001419 [Oleoguttula mirabilis]|uniref:Uncharacterized protein n=1 Tax=Oleoguttula mirabilis TaxID=1507867 RepID=A0AAV9JNS5_9PEZI|nr:hypothetical protein LTR36_001419 [Oleoguttula mirabilis]